MTTPEQMRISPGAQVYDASGDPVGTVGAVYADADTGEALWIRLGPGLFRTRPAVAPLHGAQVTPGKITLGVDKRQTEAAPAPPDLDQPMPGTLIDDLYRHFGLATGKEAHPTGADPDDADAMTRSEERLRVGTERQVTGRVRLRRYVETEYVQVEVPIRRERVRLEEVPASADEPPPAAEPDDAAMTLHEERPVIGKQTVPVERVRLAKQTVTGEEAVRDQVRTEHIEADLPGDEPRRLS